MENCNTSKNNMVKNALPAMHAPFSSDRQYLSYEWLSGGKREIILKLCTLG